MKLHYILCALVLSGCATTHSDFYTSLIDPVSANQLAPLDGPPQIARMSSDPETTVLEYFKEGYGLVGFSNFVSAEVDEKSALTLAAEVGAKYVVVSSQYQSTKSGAIPITTNRTVTTTSTATGSAYGSGGYATGTAYGTSTTIVPTTTYIPYSVDRYEVLAMYFAPLKPHCFGVLTADAEDEVKSRLQKNQVVQITAVRRGSPAYNYNLLVGDYVLALDEKPFDLASGRFSSNQNVEFSVWRNGEVVSVPLTTGVCQQ